MLFFCERGREGVGDLLDLTGGVWVVPYSKPYFRAYSVNKLLFAIAREILPV